LFPTRRGSCSQAVLVLQQTAPRTGTDRTTRRARSPGLVGGQASNPPLLPPGLNCLNREQLHTLPHLDLTRMGRSGITARRLTPTAAFDPRGARLWLFPRPRPIAADRLPTLPRSGSGSALPPPDRLTNPAPKNQNPQTQSYHTTRLLISRGSDLHFWCGTVKAITVGSCLHASQR